MAEEEKKETETTPEADSPAKKKGVGKILLIVGGVVLLLAAIGVPLTLYLVKSGSAGKEVSSDAAEQDPTHGLVPEGFGEEVELLEGEEPLGGMLPFDSFVVNLSGGRYLRCQMQLEFVGRDVPKKVIAKLVPIRDAILTLLTSRSAEDILGSQGRDALKRDIRDLVNESVRQEEVKNVYFTQFVVQ